MFEQLWNCKIALLILESRAVTWKYSFSLFDIRTCNLEITYRCAILAQFSSSQHHQQTPPCQSLILDWNWCPRRQCAAPCNRISSRLSLPLCQESRLAYSSITWPLSKGDLWQCRPTVLLLSSKVSFLIWSLKGRWQFHDTFNIADHLITYWNVSLFGFESALSKLLTLLLE